MIRLWVMGTPAPQGSKRHVGHGRMVESSKAVGPWREAIVAEAKRQGAAGAMIGDAAAVTVTFLLRRPASHYGTGRNAGVLKATAPKYPTGRPDLDKTARAVLDALTQSGLIADDAIVVDLHARKRYAEKGSPTGAIVEIGGMG